jgi:hypothetical protein
MLVHEWLRLIVLVCGSDGHLKARMVRALLAQDDFTIGVMVRIVAH